MEVLKVVGISGKEFSFGDFDFYQCFLCLFCWLFVDVLVIVVVIEVLIDGQVVGLIGFLMCVEMDVNLVYFDNIIVLVMNDVDFVNNLYFCKVGESGIGSWVMLDYLLQVMIEDLQNWLVIVES